MTDDDEPFRMLAELLGASPGMVPQLLSVADVVRRLCISRATFYRLVAAGRLRAVRQGRRTFVVAADLAAYVRGLQQEAPTHGTTG
jgi:excisionase family DNA binding protein